MSTDSAKWFVRARLKTRQLMLLTALADEANMHRAAEALNMTQPAASKLLKELEDALGVPLFERLPRGMRATWYGESLIRHARMALSSLQQAHEEIEALKAGRYGKVAIGAITTPALGLLPGAVAQVKRQHPSLNVEIQVDSSNVLIDQLLQGRLDVVVGRLFERHVKTDLRYEALADEPIAAVTRPGHPMLASARLQLRDTVARPWIVPPSGTVLRHRFELMFQEEGLDAPADVIETTALLFITKMLQGSDMLAVISADVGRYYAEHGMMALLPLAMPCRMDGFGLITRTDRLLSPAAKVMLRAIKAAAQTAYRVELALEE